MELSENNNLEGPMKSSGKFVTIQFNDEYLLALALDVQLLRQTHSWCLRRRNIFAEPSKPSYSLLSC